MKFSFSRIFLSSLAAGLWLATAVAAQNPSTASSAPTDGAPAIATSTAATPTNTAANSVPTSAPATQPSGTTSTSAPAAQPSGTTSSGKVADDRGGNVDLAAPAAPQADPLKRDLSEKQKKDNAKKLKVELGSTYKKWINEDVRWIITPEELTAFKALSNDEERDAFIEQFWQRRDPTPDTEENEFKEEHYRRIAYANEHFAAGRAGWRTDRGRIYIVFGPPDEIESHPSGGTYDRPIEEGGGETSTYPFEKWRYRYIEGLQTGNKQEIWIEFVDTCMCGDYHISMDPNEKDALLQVPGAGLTLYEQQGLASKSDRINGGFGNMPQGPLSGQQNTQTFDRLEQWAALQQAPKIKFKDLEEVVSHKINVNLMPFDVRTDFVKVTDDTVLTPVIISVKNKDITFINKDGIQRGTANIFGRVTTLTGHIVQTFEDTVQVDVPTELLPKTQEHSSLYWKALPLRPGRYRFDVVVKDVNGDRVGTWTHGVVVPEYTEDKLASSSLILADHLEKVPAKSVGAGNFVIGQTKLAYPHIEPSGGQPASFKRDEAMNLWMQVYNLQSDEKTKKPSASIEYEIVNLADNKAVLHTSESTSDMANVGEQVTLEKRLALTSLQPGQYRLTVKVDDNVSKQQIAPSVRFAVE
jgi:GWxTD domain-containing protein